MAIAKKQGTKRSVSSVVPKGRSSHTEPSSNYDQIKEEVLTLLTGQEPSKNGEFDYTALIKRVTVILVAVYGVSRVGVLRQLAFSIVTSFITRWVVMKAADNFVPELHTVRT